MFICLSLHIPTPLDFLCCYHSPFQECFIPVTPGSMTADLYPVFDNHPFSYHSPALRKFLNEPISPWSPLLIFLLWFDCVLLYVEHFFYISGAITFSIAISQYNILKQSDLWILTDIWFWVSLFPTGRNLDKEILEEAFASTALKERMSSWSFET